MSFDVTDTDTCWQKEGSTTCEVQDVVDAVFDEGVVKLHIRGEYIAGDDSGHIDEVTFKKPTVTPVIP